MKNPVSAIRENYSQRSADNLYRLDGMVPLNKAIPLGIQHVLSMFFANIAPLLIVFASIPGVSEEVLNNGIRSAIFFAAVGTCIQLFPIWRIGAKLPIVVGLSFTFVGMLCLIGQLYGLPTLFVSLIIGGLAVGILGLFAKYWRRFIKPIVSSTVVLGIGLSLIPVGIAQFLSSDVTGVVVDGAYQFDVAWPFLLVAFVTLLSGILFQIFLRGVWWNLSILLSLLVGYALACCFIPYNGMVDFSAFHISGVGDIINVPMPIFVLVPFTAEAFNIGAIVSVFIIYLVASTECIGDVSSLTKVGLQREATEREISGALASDGFVSALAACFGAMPLTTYAQNVGIVGQTKIVNRFTLFTGIVLLFLASFFPPVATLIATIPSCVIGGCMLTLFASILIIGMQMISECGFSKRNVLNLSISIGLGYGITFVPAFTQTAGDGSFLDCLKIVLQNPVPNMFFLSLLLSYVLPKSMDKENDEKSSASE